MALDPNIILQLQGYKPPDQMQGMQQAMTLGNLMQQRQMGDMQMQQQQRALADDQAVRQAYQQAGGDQAKLGEALRASGQYKAYQAFQQSQFDRQKQQADIAKSRAQANEINQKLIRESMPMLGTNPSDDSVMQASQRLKNLGAFDDAGAKAFAAQFTGLPMDQRGRAIMQFAADPAAYIKMMTPDIAMTDAGGAVVPVDRNAFTNPNQQAIAKTATPGDLLTDARGKASNAIAGGNLRVAQGNLAVNQGRLKLDQEFPKMHVSETADGTMLVDERGRIPARAVIGPDGKPLSGKPPTEGQAVAAGFADRMTAAEKIMQNVGEKGDAGYKSSIAGSVPFVGNTVQRWFSDEAQQKVKQAQDDWIRAKLRKESGAVIGADEMESERQTYFPMPGEESALRDQKRQARELAQKGMVRMAGGGYKPIEPDQPESGNKGASVSVKPSAGPQMMDAKPMPSKVPKGAVITDRQTGQKFRNTGKAWEPIK